MMCVLLFVMVERWSLGKKDGSLRSKYRLHVIFLLQESCYEKLLCVIFDEILGFKDSERVPDSIRLCQKVRFVTSIQLVMTSDSFYVLELCCAKKQLS